MPERNGEIVAQNVDGNDVIVQVDDSEDTRPMRLVFEGETTSIQSFAVLSTDEAVREKVLEKESKEVNLPEESAGDWQSRLVNQIPDDDTVVQFYADLANTPQSKSRSLQAELARWKGNDANPCAKLS